jgi:hypothetical protein
MASPWVAAFIGFAWCSLATGAVDDSGIDGLLASDAVDAAEVPLAVEPMADDASLESRIQALESRTLVPGPMVGGRSSGWSGGAEVMFFRPCATARSLPVQYVDDAGFAPAWRLWGGLSGEGGLGVDVRWWQYDQANALGPADTGTDLVFQKLDLVASQRLGFRHWDLQLFAGPTYAGNGMRNAGPGADPLNRYRWRFDGAGLTAGMQMVRGTPWLHGLALAAGVQGSAVFGPSVMPGSSFDPGAYRQATTCATIFELSFGPRWERRLRGGATAFAGGACEAQFWSAGLGSESQQFFPAVGFWGGDIGLIGFTCNVGIRR